MALRRLVLHPEALQEAEDARAWYRERSSAAAERFTAELSDGMAQVTQSPTVWPAFRRGTRRYLLRNFPYSIVFVLKGDSILVLAVAHDKRRAGYWASRLRESR